MAPSPRRSTGKAAPAKASAASAVAKNESLTVESDTPVAVDTHSSPHESAEAAADAEDARQAAEREAEKAARESADTTEPKPAPRVQTESQDAPVVVSTEVPTVPAPVPLDHVVTPEVAEAAAAKLEDPKSVSKDINALRALADTAGDPVTPYGGTAPAPLPPMPKLREVHDWTREGDSKATARVVVDGFRPRVNGAYRFARRGDRISAPVDVIAQGIKRGVLRSEEG